MSTFAGGAGGRLQGLRPPRVCALLAIAALVGSCGDAGSRDACAGKSGAAGPRQVVIESGGTERSFRLVAPNAALHGTPAALVLLYHGSNGDGAKELAVTGLDAKAATEGFIVAAGDGIDRSWNTGFCRDPDGRACVEEVDDVAFTRAMIGAIEDEYCVDTARVYATGFSKGAAMVFRLACAASDVFAAFAPVAGALSISDCAPAAPRPILLINNATDAQVPLAAGKLSFTKFLELNACGDARSATAPAPTATCEIAPDCAEGATTAFCTVEGGHRWPGGTADPGGVFAATDAVWQFFAVHPRESGGR